MPSHLTQEKLKSLSFPEGLSWSNPLLPLGTHLLLLFSVPATQIFLLFLIISSLLQYKSFYTYSVFVLGTLSSFSYMMSSFKVFIPNIFSEKLLITLLKILTILLLSFVLYFSPQYLRSFDILFV